MMPYKLWALAALTGMLYAMMGHGPMSRENIAAILLVIAAYTLGGGIP